MAQKHKEEDLGLSFFQEAQGLLSSLPEKKHLLTTIVIVKFLVVNFLPCLGEKVAAEKQENLLSHYLKDVCPLTFTQYLHCLQRKLS